MSHQISNGDVSASVVLGVAFALALLAGIVGLLLGLRGGAS